MKQRQKEILKELIKRQDNYVSSETLSYIFGVSNKTVQNDIKIINDHINGSSALILAKAGLGYKIEVYDRKSFENFLAEINKTIVCRNFNEEHSRIVHIMYRLFNSHSKIIGRQLLDELFISESRMMLDLKRVKDIFSNYNLVLRNKRNEGYYVFGSEIDKRRCIIHEKIHLDILLDSKSHTLKEIGDIVINSLTSNCHIISDLAVQNIVIHLMVIIKRTNQGNWMESLSQDLMGIDESVEMDIANEIAAQLANRFSISLRNEEIVNIAIHIKGKRNYTHGTIDSETDRLTSRIFTELKMRFDVDFSNLIENRVALSLHIIALVFRAEHRYQLNYQQDEELRKNSALAYEFAIVAANMISDAYQIKILAGEVGFLAIHFLRAIDDLKATLMNGRVLIVCPLRQSETLLLKHNFLNYFGKYISRLDVVNVMTAKKIDVASYDVIYTTNEGIDISLDKEIHKINYFLKKEDITLIEHTLMTEPIKLADCFKEEYYLHFKNKTKKEDIIKKLSIAMSSEAATEIIQSIQHREEKYPVSIVNQAVFSYPDHLFFEEPRLAIAVMEHPVAWENNKYVRVVVLLCAAKNNGQQLAVLFDKISALTQNPTMIDQLLESITASEVFEILKKV